jgi:hypothetical protein
MCNLEGCSQPKARYSSLQPLTLKMIHNTILEKPFGIIFESNVSRLYKELSFDERIIVTRNMNFDFESIAVKKAILDCSTSVQVREIGHSVLLDVLLEYHKIRERSKTTGTANDFHPVKFILVEIESYIPSDAEYLILLYIYLLRTGSSLPRLYVVMNCKVSPIIEVISKIFGNKIEIQNQQGRDSIALQDYILSPANYIDIISQSNGMHLILDPNDDEIFTMAEDATSNGKIIKFRYFSELLVFLSSNVGVSIVSISPTIRMNTSSLYTGNRRTKRNVCDEYLINAIITIKSINPSVRVIIPKDTTMTNSWSIGMTFFRETLLKDFSQEVVLFARSGLDLRMIYRHYSESDVQIRSRVSQNKDMLERLGFLKQARIPLSSDSFLITSMRIHPVIARIILIWNELGKPLFPILLFVAVIHSYEKTISETKEHGLKEIDSEISSNSKYGEMMEKALSIITRTNQADSSELGRTGINLKRLISRAREFFKDKCDIPILTFDIGRFTVVLSSIIREHFSDSILIRIPDGQKTGTVLFRNSKHPQIIWKVFNNPPFTEVFPIISMLERNSNRVLLYVPL